MTGQPQWQQIAEDLARRIRVGDLAVGQAIESTSQLVQRYGSSAGPVRQAVSALRSSGVLRGHAGAAVYVQRVPAEGEQLLGSSVGDRLDDHDRRLAALEEFVREHRENCR